MEKAPQVFLGRAGLTSSRNAVTGVRQAIEPVAASVLHLPPESPDLNPIEQLFARIKAISRTLVVKSKDALRIALEHCDDDESDRYLGKRGYGSTPINNAPAFFPVNFHM